MEEKDKNKILSIIEKLFRKTTDNGCTEEEAAAAAAHAQRLLARHGLTMEEAEAMRDLDKNKDEIDKLIVDYEIKPWAWQLQAVIAKNFRCRALFRGSRSNARAIFLGHKNDAEIARKVFEELYVVGEVLTGKEYRRYVKEHGGKQSGWMDYRKSWQKGYVDGIEEGLIEQVNRYSLVVVVPEDVMAMKFGYGNTPSQRGGWDAEAYNRGQYDGKSVMKARRMDEVS